MVLLRTIPAPASSLAGASLRLARHLQAGDQDVHQRADAQHEGHGADAEVAAQGDSDGQHDRLEDGAHTRTLNSRAPPGRP